MKIKLKENDFSAEDRIKRLYHTKIFRDIKRGVIPLRFSEEKRPFDNQKVYVVFDDGGVNWGYYSAPIQEVGGVPWNEVVSWDDYTYVERLVRSDESSV